MRKVHLLGILMMSLTLAVFAGCNGQQAGSPKDKDQTPKKGGEHDDHAEGPHGGTIIEFGKWHGEFTVDHKTQEATVFILEVDSRTTAPLPVEKLLLSIKTPQFQVDLKAVPDKSDPSGKSSRFVAKHENFGKAQEFEGTLSGVVDGKPYASDFKEEKNKDHKHEP